MDRFASMISEKQVRLGPSVECGEANGTPHSIGLILYRKHDQYYVRPNSVYIHCVVKN